MKFEIKNETPEEEPVVLYLKKQPNGVVWVNAYKRSASNYTILVFNIDGTIYLPGNITPELGFKLDEKRRIQIK